MFCSRRSATGGWLFISWLAQTSAYDVCGFAMRGIGCSGAVLSAENGRLAQTVVLGGLRAPEGTPEDWPWSRWRFYFSKDTSILAMDNLP